MIVGTQCTSERILNTDSDLDWRRSRKTLLTEFGAESGETNNTKVVENFDILPESIDTPSHDQQFRSYDLYKLGVLLELLIWIEWHNFSTLGFGLNWSKIGGTLDIEVVGNFISFVKRGETQNFDNRRRNHEALKLIGFSRYAFELESIFKFF
jgi:hypothetical protein